MTLEAWVKPTTLGNAYRTVVFKEQPGNEVYALYANQPGTRRRRSARSYVGGYKDAVGRDRARRRQPGRTWPTTYDGSSVRLYVNGTLVATTAAAGSLASSTAPLRIGGNTSGASTSAA